MALRRHTGVKGRNEFDRKPPALRRPREAKSRHAPPGSAAFKLARPLQFGWAETISEAEWELYRRAITAIRTAGIPFELGGGFALATFVGRWRDTKDIDFYIRAQDRSAAVAALAKAGFNDYYGQKAYDRNWIYRSVQSGVIVDMIWSMANQRTQVDELWFRRAGSVSIRGEKLQVIPMEEFMWCKLYIIQRDHCDWTDLLNLVYAKGEAMDWEHLMWRLGDDSPLLRAFLTLYGWLCPKAARRLPGPLWERLGMEQPISASQPFRRDRIRLLDSRRWFAALCAPENKLET